MLSKIAKEEFLKNTATLSVYRRDLNIPIIIPLPGGFAAFHLPHKFVGIQEEGKPEDMYSLFAKHYMPIDSAAIRKNDKRDTKSSYTAIEKIELDSSKLEKVKEKIREYIKKKPTYSIIPILSRTANCLTFANDIASTAKEASIKAAAPYSDASFMKRDVTTFVNTDDNPSRAASRASPNRTLEARISPEDARDLARHSARRLIGLSLLNLGAPRGVKGVLSALGATEKAKRHFTGVEDLSKENAPSTTYRFTAE